MHVAHTEGGQDWLPTPRRLQRNVVVLLLKHQFKPSITNMYVLQRSVWIAKDADHRTLTVITQILRDEQLVSHCRLHEA